MISSRVRAAGLAVAASVGLSACSTYGGLGYGGYGSGISVGIGNAGYDRYCDPYGYGYSPYGYRSSRYGYSPYGYGYGDPRYGYGDPRYGYGNPRYGYSPYGYAGCGWHDGFYYPGAGYYVYRDGRRYRWTDEQRRYWEQQREQARREGRVLNRWQRHVEDQNQSIGEQRVRVQSREPRRVERRSVREGGALGRIQRRVERRQSGDRDD